MVLLKEQVGKDLNSLEHSLHCRLQELKNQEAKIYVAVTDTLTGLNACVGIQARKSSIKTRAKVGYSVI